MPYDSDKNPQTKNMKLFLPFRNPALAAALIAAVSFSSVPITASAKDKDKDDKKGRSSEESKGSSQSKSKGNPQARTQSGPSSRMQMTSQAPQAPSRPSGSPTRSSQPSRPQIQVQTRSQPQVRTEIVRRPDDRSHDRSRSVYQSHPRSGFTLSLGNGYAGRGYYYGPPNTTYFYERPDVRYYSTRESAPREYYANESYSSSGTDYSNVEGLAVQRALTRLGYYSGVIDGEIGPVSSRAIQNYQSNNGLRATGEINAQLLQSLGIN